MYFGIAAGVNLNVLLEQMVQELSIFQITGFNQ
jgi:hypothetical protein